MFAPLVRLAGFAMVGAVVFIASGPSFSNIYGVAQWVTATPAPTTNSTATSPSSSTGTSSTGTKSTSATTAGTTTASTSLPTPVTDVTQFGAVGDGHTDSEPAVVRAVQAAQSHGGTLYFPAGHYMLYGPGIGGAIKIQSGLPLTVAGAGADVTVLTETNPKGALLSAQVDHTVVQDLTLDTLTVNARQALNIGANYVTVQRCVIHGGSQIFTIYATGPSTATTTAPTYRVGNRLLNDVITDQLTDDGISWSFQADSLLENIDHTGSRLALYIDKNVTVQSYTYHPGSQLSGTAGFWISAPSDNITINNFTSYGKGGVVSDNGGRMNSNITINNERLLGTGKSLRVSGINGLTISGCDFGNSNALAFEGTSALSNVVVQNCTALPLVTFGSKGALSVMFSGDTFPALVPVIGPKTTFRNYSANPLTFWVSGGLWQNQAGGFFSGSAATYTVSSLVGY